MVPLGQPSATQGRLPPARVPIESAPGIGAVCRNVYGLRGSCLCLERFRVHLRL
jgi:hypothetical protein